MKKQTVKKSESFECGICEKHFKASHRPVYITQHGENWDETIKQYPTQVCGRCWRSFWIGLKKFNPWLEGGMPI